MKIWNVGGISITQMQILKKKCSALYRNFKAKFARNNKILKTDLLKWLRFILYEYTYISVKLNTRKPIHLAYTEKRMKI